MVADFAFERLDRSGGDIGGIGDDQIEWAGECVEQVAKGELDGRLQRGGVGARDFESGRREVGCGDGVRLEFKRKRDGENPGAGADVGDAAGI